MFAVIHAGILRAPGSTGAPRSPIVAARKLRPGLPPLVWDVIPMSDREVANLLDAIDISFAYPLFLRFIKKNLFRSMILLVDRDNCSYCLLQVRQERIETC